MGPGGGAVGGFGQFLGPAAQRFHQVLGPGRGAVRGHRQVAGAQVEDIAGFPGPVGGTFGNGLQIDGLAFQRLGDGMGPEVGVFRHLRQLHGPLVNQAGDGFAPFRRLVRGPGQVAGLAAEGFGNLVDPGFGLGGRIDQLPHVPAQRLGVAPQALPPLPERNHHPQKRQRRQGPGGQPADFVRQKLGDVVPAQHRLDVIIDPPHPCGAEDQPAEGVKPETEVKRRFPRIGVAEAGVRDVAGGTGAAAIGYCRWVEAVVLGRIATGLALGGAAFLPLPFGHDVPPALV